MSSLKAFLNDYSFFNYSIEEIEKRYVEWVTDDTYMILSRWNNLEKKNNIFAVKCAKRGNDVYRYRVYQRFKDFYSMAEKLVFFNPKDRGIKKTRALFVTFTYNTKRCSFKDAWKMIGVEFNRFMAYTRKNVGKIASCRVFESFESGYPHIHCILLFEDVWFTVFRDKKGKFRIHLKNVLAKGWHSNIDVKAMYSLSGGFSYLKKYLLKGVDFQKADSKALKTLALCWAFRKRAFSVSGRFRKVLSDLIRYMHNSNRKFRQITLFGEMLHENKYIVLGFISNTVLKLKGDEWFKQLNMAAISVIDKFFK